MFGERTRRGTLRGVGAALCVLVVVLSVAGPAAAAAAADADRSQRLAAADTGDGSTAVAQSSGTADANFTVRRTAHNKFTVWVDESYVSGANLTDDVTLNISDSEGNLVGTQTWDIGESTVWNGTRNETFKTPGHGLSVRGSLAEATVELNGTGISDTAPLHSVFLGEGPVWTNGSQHYVVTAGTTGVGANDTVTAEFGEREVDADLRSDGNLLVLQAKAGDKPTPDLTVKSDGVPIAEPRSVGPDIRLTTDEVQLWHPAVDSGTEYTVTVHSIDGTSVDNSMPAEATGAGTVPIPNATDVVGAQKVNVSLTRGETALLNQSEITDVDQPVQTDAAVTSNGTVQFKYSLTSLGIDAATITGDSANDSAYLEGDSLSLDGQTLSLSGTTVNATDTLRLQTDAGVLNVSLSEASGGGSNGSQPGGSGEDQSSLLGGVLSVLFPAGLLVPFLAGAIGAGLYIGRERGEPDYINVGLGVVAVACVIVLAYFIGQIFKISPLQQPLVIGGALGMLLVGASSYAVGGRALHDGTASRGRHSSGAVTHDVTVTVSDGSGPISGRCEISARKQGSDERVTETVRDGRAALQLSSGNWVVEATHGGYSSSPETIRFGQLESPDSLRLPIDLPEVSLTVRDPDRDAPIPNASVRLDGDGQTLTKKTDSDGAVSFDPPSGAERVTITTVHDRYHESVSEFALDGSVTETIALDAKTGTLSFVTSIDGTRTGGMDITISPADDHLNKLYGSDVNVTSEPDGTHRSSSIPVGRYRAAIDPPASTEGLYRSSEVTFEVTEGDRTEVEMDAAFTWELSRAHRDRISQIRRDMDQITGKSGIDLAIPNYYASVIETVLDAVEAFPEQGDQLISAEAHPDEITEATLEAAGAAVETVADAMSTKRNRDLFTACADMPDATVRWQGGFDLPALVERLNEDQMAVRRSYAARADSVSDRIDAERGAVSETAPARSMLDEVGIESRGDHVDEVVATHVAIMLLDAVDELFDHPELTERLSRTVF
ncbi:hypothetical protein [Haloarcula sediminis]|uniref:hypothetical protein n=1 Tax=Haloarcula sediminis TaxID=3111777 RepID=UPI002D797091|nr:hypothetical protein [Haloarcula sp. CK38]